MRKTAVKTPTKAPRKRMPVVQPKKTVSVDDQITEHLKHAEDHLIAAVKLFYGPRKPSRRAGYQEKLERAQEAVTSLYREELVRIRGPIKTRSGK